MSALPPDDPGSYERRRDERDPESCRREKIVTLGLLAFVLVLLVSFVATRGSRDGVPTSLGLDFGTSQAATSDEAATSTETSPTTTPDATTTTVMVPIEVESVPGAAIIAGHIACTGESGLDDSSIETVQAAVAADNDTLSEPGGAPKPYANDAEAQSEIVRASVQELYDEQQFYADCSPVPGTAGATAGSGDTLPPSR